MILPRGRWLQWYIAEHSWAELKNVVLRLRLVRWFWSLFTCLPVHELSAPNDVNINQLINRSTLRPENNNNKKTWLSFCKPHFSESISLNENCDIFIQNFLKFVDKILIGYDPAFVQVLNLCHQVTSYYPQQRSLKSVRQWHYMAALGRNELMMNEWVNKSIS